MRERVLSVLQSVNKEIMTYTGDSMLEEGIIDSFDIIEIVAKLEEEFNIEIDAELIVIDNFKNIDSIISLIERIS